MKTRTLATELSSIVAAGVTNYVTVDILQGYQGYQGSWGSQGPGGFQGFPSSSSAEGLQGNQGGYGLQGTQGSSTIGSQGFQGIQGAMGPQGWQGRQGSQGRQGTNGYQGLQGWQGYQAYTGTQGPQGPQGSQGPDTYAQGQQGLQGFMGTLGTQGFQGLQGSSSSGSQGSDGSRGLQGLAQGVQGFQGIQGSQGSQGSQGYQGQQGAGGMTGLAGFFGQQGFQAYITDPILAAYQYLGSSLQSVCLTSRYLVSTTGSPNVGYTLCFLIPNYVLTQITARGVFFLVRGGMSSAPTSLGFCGFGVYSYNSGTYTLVAQTSDTTSNFYQTNSNTYVKIPFSSNVILAPGLYYVLLSNSTSNTCQLGGSPSSLYAQLVVSTFGYSNNALWVGYLSGPLSSLPSSFTTSSVQSVVNSGTFSFPMVGIY